MALVSGVPHLDTLALVTAEVNVHLDEYDCVYGYWEKQAAGHTQRNAENQFIVINGVYIYKLFAGK